MSFLRLGIGRGYSNVKIIFLNLEPVWFLFLCFFKLGTISGSSFIKLYHYFELKAHDP